MHYPLGSIRPEQRQVPAGILIHGDRAKSCLLLSSVWEQDVIRCGGDGARAPHIVEGSLWWDGGVGLE